MVFLRFKLTIVFLRLENHEAGLIRYIDIIWNLRGANIIRLLDIVSLKINMHPQKSKKNKIIS